MTVFALETKQDPTVLTFINETEERLKGTDMLKNPFDGFVVLDKNLGRYLIIFSMRSIFPVQAPKWFLSLVSKQGLRKAGYKDKIKSYSKKELINYMVVRLWGKKK